MKSNNILWLMFMFTFFGLKVESQDFYSVDRVNTIELTFDDANWAATLWNYYQAGDNQRLLAHAMINGESFDSVGVKFKGTSSCDSTFSKNPFNIKLDYVKKKQDVDGYSTLKLSNVFMDPSFTREVLSYEFARNYMPAPKANYIKVYVNGNYHGLYVNSQSEDNEFLKEHFQGYKDGAFFKGEFDQTFTHSGCPTTPPRIWEELSDTVCLPRYYELESDQGWGNLQQFLHTFNNQPLEMENALHVDGLLWMLAFDNLLVNLDAPINVPHNFYLYQDQANRFNPMVWDLNMAFGGYTQLGGPFGPVLTTTQLQQLNIFLNESNSEYPIIKNVLTNPRYRKMYVAHYKTMKRELLQDDWYLNRINELQSLISQDVQNDPNKFFSYNDFLANKTNSVGSIIGMQQLMEGREAYLTSQPVLQEEGPTISHCIVTELNSANKITAIIQNAVFAYVGYRGAADRKFEKLEMFDDGQHGDELAGDGLWGAIINQSVEGMSYYVYAENAQAGKFSPERAEYNYYTYSSTGELVINEVLADNVSDHADDDGEYDDWIELFNSSSSPIDLSGYCLSDDSNELMKWRFPSGTEIASQGFLVVWADKDTLQTGLHCNFKLSASGEAVYLSDNLGHVITSVSFGSQQPDISFGRLPNGTGPFISLYPTFQSVNSKPFGIDEHLKNQIQISLYPNPSSDWISIEVSHTGNVPYRIYNAMGEEVVQGIMDQKIHLPVASWSKGLYCITIQGVTRKFFHY